MNQTIYGPLVDIVAPAWKCDPKDLQKGLKAWIDFYNNERPHATFDGQTPHEVYNQLSSSLMIKAA